MSLFKSGTKVKQRKNRRHGPGLITRPGREGYYLRYYVTRENIRGFNAIASPDHGLTLVETNHPSIILTQSPSSVSPYVNYLRKGDEILSIGSTKITSLAVAEHTLRQLANQNVRFKINRGGKHGTQPNYVKAGRTKELGLQFCKTWDISRVSKPGDEAQEQDITFGHLVDHYLDWAANIGRFSPPWLKEVTRIIKLHKERWGTMPIETLTNQVVSEWVLQRSRAGASYYVLVNELKPLRTAFSLALKRQDGKWRNITSDPTKGVNLRRPPASVPKHLDHDEVQTLIRVAQQQDIKRLQPGVSSKRGATVLGTRQTVEETRRYYHSNGSFDATRIQFMLLTGLRRSQLIDLQWTDYNKERGTITLQTTLSHREKSRRVTTIPLPDEAVQILEGQPRLCDYIFPNLQGQHDAYIQGRMKRIAAGFKKETNKHVHLHMLRHTALTHLLEHTQNIAAVSKFAGHSRIQTTQVYAHVLEDQLRNITKDFTTTHPRTDAAQAVTGLQQAQPPSGGIAAPPPPMNQPADAPIAPPTPPLAASPIPLVAPKPAARKKIEK